MPCQKKVLKKKKLIKKTLSRIQKRCLIKEPDQEYKKGALSRILIKCLIKKPYQESKKSA